jgi:hypothetical protein
MLAPFLSQGKAVLYAAGTLAIVLLGISNQHEVVACMLVTCSAGCQLLGARGKRILHFPCLCLTRQNESCRAARLSL